MREFLVKSWVLGQTLWAYKQGRAVVNYPPLYLWIELTNHCNLQCVMCAAHLSCRPKGYMSLELFQRIIDQAKSFRPQLNLHLAGEPLLHPALGEMIAYATRQGLFTGLFTNATLLDSKHANMLLDSGLNWLGFSFDGYDQSTYERVRQGAQYEQTLANIESFLRQKKQRGGGRPYTYLNLIALPHLCGAVDPAVARRFRRHLQQLGLDQFEEVRPHNWAGQLSQQENMSRGSRSAQSYTRCPAPWSTLAITWNGQVLACCLDSQAQYVIADLQQEPLQALFNHPRLQFLRRAMARGRARQLALCRHCCVLDEAQYLGIPAKVWQELGDWARTLVHDWQLRFHRLLNTRSK